MGIDHKVIFGRLLLPLAIAMPGLFASAPASAQTARSWVSALGDDVNPCSRTAPCKTFAGAINKTNAGGEIDCLDPGGYGAVTITKAIVITCNGIGNSAVLATSSTNGITVNAGSSDVVVIDGLEIAGGGSGLNGIIFNTGAALIVRNTTIRGFNGYGIFFRPTAEATLNVDNCSLLNSSEGIDLYPQGSASVRANVSRSQFSNNGYGVYADGTSTTGSIFMSMRSTTVANSKQIALYTVAGSAAYSTLAVDEVTVSGSTNYGLDANGARAGMLVNNSTITNNQGGGVLPSNGGVIYSYGNNRVNGNNMKDGTFTATLSQR